MFFVGNIQAKGQDSYDLGGPVLLSDILINNLYYFKE